MTAEEKLDAALSFLASEDAYKGSYVYPEAIDLKRHLVSQKIHEKEHLPILLHLHRGKYVDLYYDPIDNERKGEFPKQIKITFKGIKFNEKGGYVELLKKEAKEARRPYLLAAYAVMGTFLGSLLIQWLFMKKPDVPDTINVMPANPVIIHDTVYISTTPLPPPPKKTKP